MNPEALCTLKFAKEIHHPKLVVIEHFSNGMTEVQQVDVNAASQ
jgi:hypothetical protein